MPNEPIVYRTALIVYPVFIWLNMQLNMHTKSPENRVRLHVTETTLGPVPGTEVRILPGKRMLTNRRHLMVSPDLNHLAYFEIQDGKQYLVKDGIAGKAYEYAGAWNVFSPDSKHVAYSAVSGKTSMIVHDDVEGPGWKSSSINEIVFSPDSQRLGYVVENEYFHVVIDGKVSPPYEIRSGFATTQYPIFSADSRHYAYRARRDGKEFIVRDGIEGKKYAYTADPRFSPDGKRLAYMALHRNDAFRTDFVVIDGIEGKGYKGVDKIQFRPDSRHVVYHAWDDKKYHVVVGETEMAGYDDIGELIFTHDGRRMAYKAQKNGKEIIVVDGRETKDFDQAFMCNFSPNGKRIGFVARRGQKEFLVVDGREGHLHDHVLGFEFSPDSKRIAYVAMRGQFPPSTGGGLCSGSSEAAQQSPKFEMIVIDGKIGPEYGSVGRYSFSHDSRRFAYVATQKSKQFVVVDGKEGKRCDSILFGPMFTPDNKHVVYAATHNDKCTIVVDGREAYECDEFIASNDGLNPSIYLQFDVPNSFHFIAIKDKEAFRVNAGVTSLTTSPAAGMPRRMHDS